MTIGTYTSIVGHGSDTDYRSWVSDYSALLDQIGLVKTSDTGQIDISTAVRPGANTMGGYEIRRLVDSLDAIAPVLLKIKYGTSTNAAWPAMTLQIGTGSDGSGNLTGLVGAELGMLQGTSSAAASRPTFGCMTEGFVGVMHRVNGVSNSYISTGNFAICRTCDANGYPTAEGLLVIYGGGQTRNGVSFRFKSPQAHVGGPSSSIFSIPLDVAGTVEGEIPYYPIWVPLPGLFPVAGLLGYPQALVPNFDTTEIAIVGSLPRTYMLAFAGLQPGNHLGAIGMLWE